MKSEHSMALATVIKLPFLFLLSFLLLITLRSHSQDRNSQAVSLYVEAEENYGKGEFAKAVEQLNRSISMLGTPNSKILFLKIESLGKIYTTKYEYTNDMDTSIRVFFRMVDKANYPEDKYFAILKLNDELQAFKKKDDEFYKNAKSQFEKATTKDYPMVRSSIETYLTTNQNTYHRSELRAMTEKIDQHDTAVANRGKSRNFLHHRGTFTLISLGYGAALGTQHEEFKNVQTLDDLHTLFNGGDYPVGAKYQLRVGLFDKLFPIFTTSFVQLGINWTIIDGEYITWDWKSNSVFTSSASNGTSTSEFVKKVDLIRAGTKIGPTLSTGLAKAVRIDFYYNVRPGVYLITDPKQFNFAVTSGSTSTSYSLVPSTKFSDLSFCHEFGAKFKVSHIVINPYFTFGNYVFTTTLENKGSVNASSSSYKSNLKYSFAGITLGYYL